MNSPLDARIRHCLERRPRLAAEVRRLEGELLGYKEAHAIVASDTIGTVQDLHGALEELEKRIRATRLNLAMAREELQRLEGEIEALMSAREVVSGNRANIEEYDDYSSERSNISDNWRKILTFFVRQLPNAASIDDVMAFAGQNEITINRNAVRSQLHLYVQRGFLKRITDGVYMATDAVKRVC